MSFFLLPQQSVIVRYDPEHDHQPPTELLIKTPQKEFSVQSGEWPYTALNQAGVESVVVTPKGQKPATLNFFTMVPSNKVKKGVLNGYRIGEYPRGLYKNLEIYRAPTGFIEVTPENRELFISPRYQLKQFECKQKDGFPKYVLLQTRLLRKLEFLTDVVKEKGVNFDRFVVMSGYRTPFYNSAIKNKKWSRHQWGGAADIYIDHSPADGTMDDLNKDGIVNINDSKFLASIIESFYKKPMYQPYIGGLGVYKANPAHGPFIHVDVRGFRARW